ncbi:MAG: 5-(carboxyamino)imidazole ribonucleotide mutase [Acidobacteriota bacterium]|nr:5-(carboxyamino)imidazole ribonucleotide mutase [Acidobacteriota bacterium]
MTKRRGDTQTRRRGEKSNDSPASNARTHEARASIAASPRRRVASQPSPLVSVIMGSKSDWETMRHADDVLTKFDVPHECRIVSAHRTPAWMTEFASQAESRGLKVIIAGAGGAAHLPGMVAAQTIVPVLGVPVESRALKGIDSLLSIVQMPAGIPVGTLAIGQAGATNAALLAIAILANEDESLRARLRDFRREQERQVRESKLEGQA